MDIQLYDTTLRDGTQGEGVSFSAGDKIAIARRLDAMGIDFIEGGWPGSNPKDMEFFARAAEELELQHARLTAFGSTCRVEEEPAQDRQIQLLLQADTPAVALFGKTSLLHVRDVLRTHPHENLRMIAHSVRYVAEEGRDVLYDAEHFFDGYKEDPHYALATLEQAYAQGSRLLVLCETNGGCMPWEVGEIVCAVRKHFGFAPLATPGSGGTDVPFTLGIHAHNDSAVGVANTLEAVRHGVTHVQGTINGYGERCGNANLISVIANLQLKMGLQVLTPEKLAHLTELAHVVSEMANLPPAPTQPFVGSSAFAHKGGTHVNAFKKNPATYQHIDPAQIGNHARVLVSELSGKDNIAIKLEEYGIDDLSPDEERRVLSQIKELENSGFAFEASDASVALLMRRAKVGYRAPFELIDFTTTVGHSAARGSLAEARVKIKVGEQIQHEVGEGNGPVNALDRALRKALLPSFPQLKRIKLTDYKVRILDGHAATAAQTRVLITSTDGEASWNTVGASPNIIEASWLALTDSFAYFLHREAG